MPDVSRTKVERFRVDRRSRREVLPTHLRSNVTVWWKGKRSLRLLRRSTVDRVRNLLLQVVWGRILPSFIHQSLWIFRNCSGGFYFWDEQFSTFTATRRFVEYLLYGIRKMLKWSMVCRDIVAQFAVEKGTIFVCLLLLKSSINFQGIEENMFIFYRKIKKLIVHTLNIEDWR